MRYILNDSGYIQAVSFNNLLQCQNKTCTEYTGEIPIGYENLAIWSETANINAYKIENGNLAFDSEENERLQSLWATQQASGGSDGITGDTLPIGSMIPYGKATAPTNWLICDGSVVSRTTYAELFAVIGTSYGAGDGSTTFNLPNKKGKVSVGLDTNDTDFNTIGKTGGSKELQAHSHALSGSGGNMYYTSGSSANWVYFPVSEMTYPPETKTSGTGNSGNLQPYEVDNWIIKAFQSSGVVGNVLNVESDSITDTYSCDYINKLNIYSTEEKQIGIWCDGKPVYQKTFIGNIESGTVILSNINALLDARGSGLISGVYRVIPYFEIYNSKNYGLTVSKNGSEVVLSAIHGSTSSTAYDCNIILEYTKTTD